MVKSHISPKDENLQKVSLIHISIVHNAGPKSHIGKMSLQSSFKVDKRNKLFMLGIIPLLKVIPSFYLATTFFFVKLQISCKKLALLILVTKAQIGLMQNFRRL